MLHGFDSHALPSFQRSPGDCWVVLPAGTVHLLGRNVLGGEIDRLPLSGGELGVALRQACESAFTQLVRPPSVPLCSWGIRQKLTRQTVQDVLHLVHLELIASFFKLVAELPGLRAQPEGTGLATRAKESTPLVG